MIDQRLLELGKYCINEIVHAVYAFRIQIPSEGFSRVKALSGYLAEWYQMYMQSAVSVEEKAWKQETEMVISSVLEAVEQGDGILIADMLELQLMSQIYRVQEYLIGLGVPYYSYEVFEHNVELLNKHMPALAREICLDTQGMEACDIRRMWESECGRYIKSERLEPSSSGYATYSVEYQEKKLYVHSNGNPFWEAYLQALQYYDENREKYFLFGMGLGYLPENILRLDCSVDIMIYETDEAAMHMAVLSNPMDWLFCNPCVRLAFDPQMERLSELMTEEAVVIFMPGMIQSVSEKQLKNRLELIYMRDVNIRDYRREFVQNFRLNCKNLRYYVDELRPHFEGKNAVVVAAGPSLDKNIHLLRRLPEDVIIVATGTVYKLLVSMDIMPDYVVFLDSREGIYHQVDTLLSQQIPIFVAATAYYRVAMEYQGPAYLVCQQGYERAEAYAKRHGWDTYATGGSVSTIALDICMRLGCEEIAFVGLDLSYTDERTHAQGTRKEARAELSKLKPMSGICGEQVYVSKAFQLNLEWIEKHVSDLSNVRCKRVIDATEGGVLKRGLEVMPLEDVIKEWSSVK